MFHIQVSSAQCFRLNGWEITAIFLSVVVEGQSESILPHRSCSVLNSHGNSLVNIGITCYASRYTTVIVITFYSPICLGQETAKGPFGLRVKLPPAHLSTTHGGGFILSLQLLNVKQGSCEYQFL